MGAIVAIVGRPNVGKSTFFNRLIQRREAIVDAVSGVTRDRHYGKSDWNGKEFSLIDTGGYVVGSDDVFEQEIDRQVELAIDEADAIIFMVDVETGVTGMDEDVAKLLRRVEKPVFLAINKVDNAQRAEDAVEFYALGLGEYYTLSSINGSGTGELLDALVEVLPEKDDEEDDDELPKTGSADVDPLNNKSKKKKRKDSASASAASSSSQAESSTSSSNTNPVRNETSEEGSSNKETREAESDAVTQRPASTREEGEGELPTYSAATGDPPAYSRESR